MTCPLCHGTGWIVLLTSRKECGCRYVIRPDFGSITPVHQLEKIDVVPRGDGIFDCTFTYTWTAPDET